MANLSDITSWLDRTLDVAAFSDVSNNGLQIDREGEMIGKVAFAVDASLASVEAAAAADAQLLVVHHGISWGGGIARISGGVGAVVRAAMKANLALYAVHLPLDANAKYGNNYELARFFGLKNLRRAFVYHGETIGVVGTASRARFLKSLGEFPSITSIAFAASPLSNLPGSIRIGICSGGAGSFAEDAKKLGCDLYLTGEADWGEVIAAENCGMPMITAGHYATETFGVSALAKAMPLALKVKTIFVDRQNI